MLVIRAEPHDTNAQRTVWAGGPARTRGSHDESGRGEAEGVAAAEPPFETQIIERYRGRESSVEEALMEMYLAGVSVRLVEYITEALWATRISPSTVSELNQQLYERIEAWRNQPITGRFAKLWPLLS